MKYAILGPKGQVNRVALTEPSHVPENVTVEEITDEQAATIQEGFAASPRKMYWLISSVLQDTRPLTPKEQLRAGLITAWETTFTSGEKALLAPVFQAAISAFNSDNLELARNIIESLPSDISETLATKREIILALLPQSEA